MEHNNLTLRPFGDGDIDLLTAWLHKDYILKWYEDPKSWLEEIRQRHGAFAWIHHFIVMDGATPVGFCQYYDCCDAGDMEDWYTVNHPGDTYSIDYLIGDEAYLGRGCGKAIVGLLTQAVRQAANPRQIVVQPDADNHASNHVLLANGYRFDEEKQYYHKLLR